MKGLVLYGPPGSGKDTITQELERIDSQFRLFRRLKVGSGRTTGYRMTTRDEVTELRSRGEIVWENSRYDSLYIIDRPALREDIYHGIPVVHLGQTQAAKAVVEAIPQSRWLIVELTCPRDLALERISARRTGDVDARMRAWDETKALGGADLRIDTSTVTPDRAAALIADKVGRLNCLR